MSANAGLPANPAVLPLLAGPLEQALQAGIGAVTGDLRLINTLLTRPTLRQLQPRGTRVPDFNKTWKVEAALIYLKGELRDGAPNPEPCVHCDLLGVGPYAHCVMFANTIWGCANRKYSNEGTNCQYSSRNQGVISLKMINRNPGPRSDALLARSQLIAPTLQADYLQWRANEVAQPGFLNTATAPTFARVAIQRVATRTQRPNHLLQPVPPGPPSNNVEILEGPPQHCNGITEARLIASESGTVGQKYTAAAETPARVVNRLLQERQETLVLVFRDPGYIYMMEDEQKMVRQELMDMMDRRFTQAVVTAMGGSYTIICVATAQQSVTTLLFRLPDTLPHFEFHVGKGVTWTNFNRAQRINPTFP